MKLLFDQNLSYKLCNRLADLFPGSSHVRLLGMDQSEDHNLWKFAGVNDFTFVTQDSDFADMAALFGPPPKIIWLRCGNQPTVVLESKFRLHADLLHSFEGDDSLSCLELF